ncbi:hypothetical protein Tco_0151371 [Tanacetum coccineum]
MSKNDMTTYVSNLIETDLRNLVKTYRIPLDLHPRFPDPNLTIDHLPNDGTCICTQFLRFSRNNTTAPAAEGTLLPLPTSNEVAVAEPDRKLAKKSKALVKRKASTSLDVEGTDLSDYCTLLENTLEREEGTYSRAIFTPSPRLGKRLGSPPLRLSHVASSDPSHVGTFDAARASSSGYDVVRKGAASTGSSRKAEAKILKDDFPTPSLGEEIDLTLFPLAFGPYVMPYPFDDAEGSGSPEYTREVWDGPHALEANILSNEIFKDPDTALVTSKACLREKLKYQENKELHSLRDTSSEEVRKLKVHLTEVKVVAARSSDKLACIDAKLSDQALVMRSLQNDLAFARSRSQEYKDVVVAVEHHFDDVRGEDAHFVGSGVDCLVRKLLSSDDFNFALARVFYLGNTSGVERGCVAAAAEGALSEMAEIQSDKIVRWTTPASSPVMCHLV